MIRKAARWYCVAAGACDVTTGLLLLAAPELTLGLMGITGAAIAPVGMRFIGAFVLGVGSLYLYGIAREPRGGARLTHLMEATAIVRGCVALFTGWAIASGDLPAAWSSVCATDAIFSIAQIALLRRDAFGRGE